MKKNYYAKVLALTVAASMVSVPAFAEEGDGTAVAAQEQGKEGENEQISKDSEEETKEQTIKGETPATEPTTQVTTGDEAITITPQSEGGVISEDTEWTDETTLAENLTIAEEKTLTLKGQVTISGDVTISGGTIKRDEAFEDYMIVVPEGSSLTLKDVTIDGGAVWNGAKDATIG